MSKIQSVQKVSITIILFVGVLSKIFQYLSLGHNPRTSDELVFESISLSLGLLFIILIVLFVAYSIFLKFKKG